MYPVLGTCKHICIGYASKYLKKHQAVGSREGAKQILAKNIDFGVYDKPILPDELEKNGLNAVSHIGGFVDNFRTNRIVSGQ